MRKTLPLIGSLAVLGLVAALIVHVVAAQPQRQLGGPRGEMMRQRSAEVMVRMACSIEGLWAELTFGAKLADAKLLKMRPTFQKAWDERQRVGTELVSPADLRASLEKLDAIFTGLLDNVKKETTEEEFNKLSAWLESQDMMKQRFRGMPGGAMVPRSQQEQ